MGSDVRGRIGTRPAVGVFVPRWRRPSLRVRKAWWLSEERALAESLQLLESEMRATSWLPHRSSVLFALTCAGCSWQGSLVDAVERLGLERGDLSRPPGTSDSAYLSPRRRLRLMLAEDLPARWLAQDDAGGPGLPSRLLAQDNEGVMVGRRGLALATSAEVLDALFSAAGCLDGRDPAAGTDPVGAFREEGELLAATGLDVEADHDLLHRLLRHLVAYVARRDFRDEAVADAVADVERGPGCVDMLRMLGVLHLHDALPDGLSPGEVVTIAEALRTPGPR